MNNVSRVFATGFIWAALTILGVAMMVSKTDISSGNLTFMMIALIIGSTIGTAAIWTSNKPESDSREASEKAKRHSRVERLMNDLNEHDIEELRYRLMSQDDEDRIPLEELINKGRGR
ncbi:MAG: hypothetical protein GC179_07075 [Anaerolineaceae bacterium]|nr:hypothetical protein [Anaerolineaceae bacterium]